MDTSLVTGATTPTSSNSSVNDALGGLDMSQFLSLMIAELQNQDPTDPMKNGEILQQIGQIRSIGATQTLTTTLNSVLLGQNVSTAGNLINKQVSALDDEGAEVQGTVDRVSIADGEVALHIGEASVKLSNVREILP